MTDARRAELGRFLRAKRRKAASPATGRNTRRRAQGLTIPEVAALAGVGTTWYSAFERGAPIRVSRRMLDNLATALNLSDAERTYLRTLEEPDVTVTEQSEVADVLREVIDGFRTGPAFVMNRRWDVLAWNDIAAAVYFLSPDDDAAARNLVGRMFTDPRFRQMHVDWERVAARMVAILHMAYGEHAGDRHYERLVAELSRDADFARLWERYDLAAYEPTHAELRHPTLGLLEFEYVSFDLSGKQGGAQRLVLHPPVPGSGTAERIMEQMPAETTARATPSLVRNSQKN